MRHPRLLTRRVKQLAILTLAVTSLINWVGIQAPALAPGAARAHPSQGGSKEAMVARMIELDATIGELKGRLAANPNDKNLAAALADAYLESDSLSAQLGGDRAPPPAQPGDEGPLAPQALAVVPPVPPGCAGATTATFSITTPVPIPESGGPVATSTIAVAGAGVHLFDVDVTLNITHTFPGDLDFTLLAPSGKIVTLSSDNGSGNDNVFAGTTFDDQANPGGQVPYDTNAGLVGDHPYANLVVATPLAPEEALALFTGDNPNGTWTLTIDDDTGGDIGTLNSWSLSIATLPAAPTNAAPVTASNATPVPIPESGGPD